MEDYYENMFYVPLVHIKVKNWKNKKEQILNLYQKTTLEQDGDDQKVFTDFHIDAFSFNKVVQELFDDELNILLDKLDIKTKNITASWFETSKVGNYHPLHTHGCYGYSAVCYIEYDKEVHEPTIFVAPFLNFWDGNVLDYNPKVDEGSIIFFPSSIVHYTKPNYSEKQRTILSFNIRES